MIYIRTNKIIISESLPYLVNNFILRYLYFFFQLLRESSPENVRYVFNRIVPEAVCPLCFQPPDCIIGHGFQRFGGVFIIERWEVRLEPCCQSEFIPEPQIQSTIGKFKLAEPITMFFLIRMPLMHMIRNKTHQQP